MADLAWKVLYVTYDCSGSGHNWIRSINPSAGTEGDVAVTVDIVPASSPDDCSAATIAISASTGAPLEKVKVTRCIPKCSDCSSFGISITSNIFPSVGGTGVDIGSYNADATSCMKITSSSPALSNISLNNGIITGDIAENTGEDRTFRIDVYNSDGITCGNYSLRQKGASACEDTTCNDIIVEFTGGGTVKTDLPPEGGTYSLNMIYSRNCWNTPVITVEGSDGVSVDVTRKTLTVLPVGESDREIHVYFNFVNTLAGLECSKALTIKQKAPSPECYIDGPDEIDSCSGGTQQYEIKTE